MEQELWIPKAEFYTANPRSAQLREICIQIIQRADELVSRLNDESDQERRITLFAELEMLNGKLIELGVTPSMNINLPLSSYQQNPVIASEWIAGQLSQTTGRALYSEREVSSIAREFDETDIPGLRTLETSSIQSKLVDYMVDRRVIRDLGNLLDIPKSEIEKEV